MDKDTKEVIETLNLILAKMTTKDDLARFATKDDLSGLRAEMHEGFASVRDELRGIHDRLDDIETELHSHAGYAKEIDHLMQRVTAIEKHLGIKHIIPA